MFNLFVLLLFALSLFFRPSQAQFAAYPACVQPILNQNFPAECLSDSLAAQNTCLCQNANAFGSSLVTALNKQCGCTDLQTTVQLTTSYCNQVNIDIGPAFDVFIKDNTQCSSSASPSASPSSGSNSNSNSGGSTVIETVIAASPTRTSGGTITETVVASSGKSSAADKRNFAKRALEIVVCITGAILAA